MQDNLAVGANVAYALGLVVLAVVPQAPQTGRGLPDAVPHALAYGVQAGLLYWAVRGSVKRDIRMVVAFFGATAFGLFTESLQLLIPYRHFELTDLLANAVGALVVSVAWIVKESMVGPRRGGQMNVDQLLVVAGEVSGDIHAGNLVAKLRELIPDLQVFGVAGERLREAGVESVARTEDLSHMGLVEVLRELPRIRAIMQELVEEAGRRRPALAVLVDSPDFNLRLAARLRKLGIPVVLYVSPQLWAWRRGRVRKVRRLAREVLCILPFESRFYEEHQVRARFVGHPLVDDIEQDRSVFAKDDHSSSRIALLPGSRTMEVRALLPTMLGALRELPSSLVSEAVLVQAPGIDGVVDDILRERGGDQRLRRVSGKERRGALAGCSLAWTASGTATLECALLNVPMVVGYRLRRLSWALASLLVNVPHVGLVNLIAGERIAPELLQNSWNTQDLVRVTKDLMTGEGLDLQKRALSEVRKRLGGPGASTRAAEAVVEHLRQGYNPSSWRLND
ncbi:MAG: lipid-A-disaccharide synthase [Thermoanaerobaculales bacterium]|nr:lipid-A-disaccharide synthase [Thermoanaerobaculales bacterium]